MKDLLGAGELSTNSLELAKTVYPDLAQPAVKKVGTALEMTLDFLMIPIKYLGAVGKKYDMNIQKSLNDYQQKLDSIPMEEIGTVPPEIGVPIIEDLTKVTNEDLSSIYVNLLVNASLVTTSGYAHPSFINVLRSLSHDEAKIIKQLSSGLNSFCFIRFQRIDTNGSVVPMPSVFSDITDKVKLNFPENGDFYITNLISLGIIERIDTYLYSEASRYDALTKRNQAVKDDLQRQIDSLDDSNIIKQSKIDIVKGRFIVTTYGKQFIKSVTLNN